MISWSFYWHKNWGFFKPIWREGCILCWFLQDDCSRTNNNGMLCLCHCRTALPITNSNNKVMPIILQLITVRTRTWACPPGIHSELDLYWRRPPVRALHYTLWSEEGLVFASWYSLLLVGVQDNLSIVSQPQGQLAWSLPVYFFTVAGSHTIKLTIYHEHYHSLNHSSTINRPNTTTSLPNVCNHVLLPLLFLMLYGKRNAK